MTVKFEFEGRVVVVTGGTSGVGRSTVEAFVQQGARVVFTGTSTAKAKEVLAATDEIAGPGRAVFFKADNSKDEEIRNLAAYVKDELGNCEILFNNAAARSTGSVHDVDAVEKWDRIISVNLRGTFLCSHYFVPQMLEKGYGAIVNCSSISGLFGDYNAAAYNASKGGICNLTRAMAVDYADRGIRVNAICPGAIETEMFWQRTQKVDWDLDKKMAAFREAYPGSRISTAEECAHAVLFLASDRASWINGVMLPIDGGLTAYTGHPPKDKFV